MHRKIVNYTDIYKDRTPISSDVDDNCIKIKDNSCISFFNWHDDCHYDYQTLEQVFNGAQLFNLRDNKLAKNVLFKRLIDVELSNLIVPNIITFYANDEFQIWRSSKKLKVCNMFIKNLDKIKKEEFPQWTAQKQKQSEYCLIAVDRPLSLFVDPTERMLFGKIKCNIVTSDIADDNYFECNKAGLPECVKVLSDKIAGIKVNKGRLLEIDDGEIFRFFADKNAKYNGVEIDTKRPITCRYQNGEIKVVHFVDKQGQEHKPQESKENEEKTKQKQKNTACKTINDIINMLLLYKNSQYKQEDIATQDYTWLNNLSEAIKNKNTSFTMEDLMQINNYTGEIARNFKELLDEKQQPAQQSASYLKTNITNNLNNLKQIYEAKNICETKPTEQKLVSNNDNKDNLQIIKESDKIKSSHNERLNAFSSQSNDNRIKIIEERVNQHMGQVDEKKLQVLQEIANEVNLPENAKIEGIENDALVVVSDIEGRAKDFLLKLKHTGVIDRVDVDKETGKLKICLNQDFCGTIDFCGDLTAYKDDLPHFSNEIVTELFEELLEQIKKHNEENKDKDKQIQFVAVPGNHEFYNFWGDCDLRKLVLGIDGDKEPFLIKLKSLKVIAEIQKYFLQQVRDNNDDITDNDYQYKDIDINKRITLLDNECNMLGIIYNALSDKGIDPANYFDYFINYESKKKNVEENKENIKNGCFKITTKGGKITNEKCTKKDNNLFWDNITKEKLKNIFTDDVYCLPFSNILKILKSHGEGQENSGECTEWTEDLINEKLNDLKSVLDHEDTVLNKSEYWPVYSYDLKTMLTSTKDLETKMKSFDVAIKKLKQELLEKGCITDAESKDEDPISLLRPLFWDKSALLSKIVFNHRGKKFRTLHHFGLFVPENKSAKDLTLDNQNEIFAKAFLTNNQFNIDALNRCSLRHLKRDIFENNKIPTLFGHEGMWLSDAQTSKMYCVDTRHSDNLNVVCVVDSNNIITPYYTYKCIKLKNEEQKKQNQQNAVELKLGDYDGKKITLAIYDCKPQENKSIINKDVELGQQSPEDKNIVNAMFNNGDRQPVQQKNTMDNSNNLEKKTKLEEQKPVSDDDNTQIIKESDIIKNSNDENSKTLLGPNIEDLEKTVEDYVNGNTGTTEQQKVAEAISSLIVKNNASSLEKYSRTFAFSHKDKRAQQVYETYKKIANQKNIIVNDDAQSKLSMYRLSDVHYINTPCGSCL
ncbi:MAG: hypothetical protein IJT15_00075 [Rickettsiales bacterium]|nr:hypothetical protein [Rickettsiales bacterium]